MSFSKSQGTLDVQNLFTSIHIYQSLTGSNHTVTQVTTKIKNFGITLIKVTKIAQNPNYDMISLISQYLKIIIGRSNRHLMIIYMLKLSNDFVKIFLVMNPTSARD